MKERDERIIKLVRLKPIDLMKEDELFCRWNKKVYFLLSSLIFFNNQYCEENKIDLKKHYMNYELNQDSLSPRAFSICQIAKIFTFQDLVNYPSKEIIKIRLCGQKTIQEFKEFIIYVFQLWRYLFPAGFPQPIQPRILDIKRYAEFKKKQKKDLVDYFRN